jgi:hypothetical protein
VTATTAKPREREVAVRPQPPARERLPAKLASSRFIAATIALIAGAIVVLLGYDRATGNLAAGRLEIWVGVAVITSGFLVGATQRSLTRTQAVWLCCLLGAATYCAKLGREPTAFLYTDELQHVRSTAELLGGARLFVPNPMNPVLAHYPGLHVATAAISRATGLSPFVAGNIVIAAARILLMASLFTLFRRFLRDTRIAAIAVLVYAANPAFMYFDAQFSYESLALPLAVAALALILRGGDTPQPIIANLAIGFLLLATLLTHHITSIIVGPLILIFGVSMLTPRSERGAIRRRALAWSLTACVGTAAWIVFVAPDTWHYLAPDIQSTLRTVPDFLFGKVHARAPFGKSPLPVPRYEQLVGLASVALAFLFMVAGIVLARRRGILKGPLIVCALLGCLYFASLPLQLLQAVSAAPIAPRIWETSFIGLAPLAAIALHWLTGRRRRAGMACAISCAIVLVMGGATIRSGPNIRLPGPYVPSSGPLAATPDVVQAARWLLRHYGPERRVMGDQTVTSVFGAYAEAVPETYQNFGYRPWRVFVSAQVTPAGEYELDRSQTQFVVVDRRIANHAPFGGYYFSPSEPRAPSGGIPAQDLEKFAQTPGFRRVYSGGNIVIYSYNAAKFAAGAGLVAPASRAAPARPGHRKKAGPHQDRSTTH